MNASSVARLRGVSHPTAAAAARRGATGGMKNFHRPSTFGLGETDVFGDSDVSSVVAGLKDGLPRSRDFMDC